MFLPSFSKYDLCETILGEENYSFLEKIIKKTQE